MNTSVESSPDAAITSSADRPEFPQDDPTLARTSVTHSSVHRALGLLLRVESNDHRIHQVAVASFGPVLHVTDGATPDACIRLFVHHVDEEPGFRPRQPLIRSWGGAFTIAASRSSVMSGDVNRGTAMGFVSETIVANADYLRSAFIQTAFLQIAQARSIVAVHSACLARDGRALILRGDSGSGKSTLAYAALRRGYSLVAEDVIFLRSRSDQFEGVIRPDDIEVHGMPWTLHLLPEAGQLFPSWRISQRSRVPMVAGKSPSRSRTSSPVRRCRTLHLDRSCSSFAVIALHHAC